MHVQKLGSPTECMMLGPNYDICAFCSGCIGMGTVNSPSCQVAEIRTCHRRHEFGAARPWRLHIVRGVGDGGCIGVTVCTGASQVAPSETEKNREISR